MQDTKFNNLYKTLMEDNTVGDVLGATQVSQFSGDTYAPGDARLPKVLGATKKGKKKKFPIIRRTLPETL